MDDLKKLLQNRLPKEIPKDKHLHSAAHVLADEISTAFGERKRFAMYLGVINRVGVENARRIYRQLQQEAKGDLGKLFMYRCRKEPSEPKQEPKKPDAPPTP